VKMRWRRGSWNKDEEVDGGLMEVGGGSREVGEESKEAGGGSMEAGKDSQKDKLQDGLI
jgi:hypothetical protein